MEFKKKLIICLILAYLFDLGITLYFSSILGIEYEANPIFRYLIKEKEWIYLIRYSFIYLTSLSFLHNYLAKTENKIIKVLLFTVPVMHVMGGLTWVFAYFFM